jgi:hypothetical protein
MLCDDFVILVEYRTGECRSRRWLSLWDCGKILPQLCGKILPPHPGQPVCRTTKNRPVGSGVPPWIGCLVANDADSALCPLRVLTSYFDVLEAQSGNMSADDPFFQLPNADGRFTGTPLSTAVVRSHTQARFATLFPDYGPSVYFRLWTANILIAAGLTPDEQERYNDWSHTSRMRYAHTADPILVPVQRKLFAAFALC